MKVNFKNLKIEAEKLGYKPLKTGLFKELEFSTIEIENLNGDSVVHIDYMFYWTMYLKHLKFKNTSFKNVDSVSRMFKFSSNLESIDVIGDEPLFPNCYDFTGMFEGTKIKVLNISDYIGNREKDKRQLIYDSMFAGMKCLEYLNLDTLFIRFKLLADLETYKRIFRSMFSRMTKHVKINLPNDLVTRKLILSVLLDMRNTDISQLEKYCTFMDEPISKQDILDCLNTEIDPYIQDDIIDESIIKQEILDFLNTDIDPYIQDDNIDG